MAWGEGQRSVPWLIGLSCRDTFFAPPTSCPEGLPAQPGGVKVDRPEGGDPMYSWGGTLMPTGGAYNPP
jgi:hypothetical protein